MQRFHTILDTQWGYMVAAWSDRGLWDLEFPTKEYPSDVEDSQEPAVLGWAQALRQELNQYWQGFKVTFGAPVDWRGYTPFQAAVLQATLRIGYGEQNTYGGIAKEIGKPQAARAVGGALHINRTPIVVPCHRVVGANGTLTGFGGGLELKKALLLLESNWE